MLPAVVTAGVSTGDAYEPTGWLPLVAALSAAALALEWSAATSGVWPARGVVATACVVWVCAASVLVPAVRVGGLAVVVRWR